MTAQASDRADIGLIGLGVMGSNLTLNMDDHGYTVAVYNRTQERTDKFLSGPAESTKVIGTDSLEDLVASLGQPRKVMLMIPAGKPVDQQSDICLMHTRRTVMLCVQRYTQSQMMGNITSKSHTPSHML